MKVRRQMISIDEEKCNGCGLCARACHEGALRIVDGKARLVSDIYCDGLGNCIGACPQDAITFEEREAEAYDEEAVRRHLAVTRRAFRQIAQHALGGDRVVHDIVPAHAGATGCRREEPGDHLHGGGFAGAVRAEEAEHAAWFEFETDAIDGGQLAVALGQLPGFDHRDVTACCLRSSIRRPRKNACAATNTTPLRKSSRHLVRSP